jgi:hypothetical protein
LMEKMGGKMDPGIMSTETIIKGNCLPLRMIPLSTVVFALGLRRIDGAKLCRAAGSHAVVLQHEGEYTVCKLASGEVRKFRNDVCATIGVMSNEAHQHMKFGKAGRKRWLGIRPTVRGVAMNANEHPHGGGRGKSKGNKHTRSTSIITFILTSRCLGMEDQGNANKSKNQSVGHTESSERTYQRGWNAAARFARHVLDIYYTGMKSGFYSLYRVHNRPCSPPLVLFAALRQK